MNCAIHNDVPAAAYCRTCGKALCENCKRDVKGVIYCEDCIAARIHQAGGVSAAAPPPTVVSSSPNPTVAGILSGFFPFGIGQLYNRQYAKALTYMLIFAFLVWAASSSSGLEPIFGLAIAFWYFYQIVDAVRSARAIQLNQPAPDPLGINRLLNFSEDQGTNWTAAGFPVGAIILIGLGCIFLLANMGWVHFHGIGNWWPLVLIALGIWLLFRRRSTCPCVRCRCCGLMWPAILTTLGVLFQLDALDIRGFSSTWPFLLIVIGVVKILQTSGSTAGHIDTGNVPGPPSGPNLPEGTDSHSQEVSNA